MCYSVLCILEENVADSTAEEDDLVAYQQSQHFDQISSFESTDEANNLTYFNKGELTVLIVVRSGGAAWTIGSMFQWLVGMLPMSFIGRKSTSTC